jgi:hypothetical protein
MKTAKKIWWCIRYCWHMTILTRSTVGLRRMWEMATDSYHDAGEWSPYTMVREELSYWSE